MVSYPLLPEKVATDWDGVVATVETNRIIIFVFPFVMVGVTIFAKAMVSNVLYFRMPHYLFCVDKITGYISILAAIIIFTYQMNIVLYTGGIKSDFYSIALFELLGYVGFLLMILLFNKKKAPFNNV